MVTHLACEEINTRYISSIFYLSFTVRGTKFTSCREETHHSFDYQCYATVQNDCLSVNRLLIPPVDEHCHWSRLHPFVCWWRLSLITSPSFCLHVEIVTDHVSVLLSADGDRHWSRLCPFVCMWKLPLITFLSFCLHVQIVTDHVSVLLSADGDCLWSRLYLFACRWRLLLIMSLSFCLLMEIVTDHVSVLLSADGDCHWSRLCPFICRWRLWALEET